ncbi:MAG: DUF4840 domain-containing protein [Prevotella sp.]|nr:DUF4840 domain-containing protein [Prevotella sp.]
MKKKIQTARVFAMLLFLGCTISLASCSDDDDDVTVPTEITTQTMYGDYKGRMTTVTTVTAEGEETPAGVEVTAKVDNDTVTVEKFPVKDIVMSIINDEEAAGSIVEALGDINYKIGYKPALTSANDSILMVLDPEPLMLNLTIPAQSESDVDQTLVIEVKVDAGENAAYSVADKKLKFSITARKVLIGEGEEKVELPGFTPAMFSFDLKKTK